jgi:hypothetical protein
MMSKAKGRHRIVEKKQSILQTFFAKGKLTPN